MVLHLLEKQDYAKEEPPEVWRAFLFYGVGGPGDWFARNGVSADDGRAIMHIQMA